MKTSAKKILAMKTSAKKTLEHFALAALSIAISSTAVTAENTVLQSFLQEGKTALNFRYRFEGVDQDNFDKEASANTLRTRLAFQSGKVENFSALLEFDDLRALGSEHYNSTTNGHIRYPVVADPEGTEVNQALLEYQRNKFTAAAGRQRINHIDQRFVGGVGWRQNEQTYDGLRARVGVDRFTADYSYVYNVNRIFGPEGDNANYEGDFHLLTGGFSPMQGHTLAAFFYGLDFEDAANLSSNTYGMRYSGDFDILRLTASYALQSDTGDNPVSYETDYVLIEVNGKAGANIGWKAGFEILGSDDGDKGFTTPLATLHKFQGYADKFLTTPDGGIEDLYAGAGVQLGPVNLTFDYHRFESDEGSKNYGREVDITATYPLAKNLKALLKYAEYNADEFATDTQKLWFMVELSL